MEEPPAKVSKFEMESQYLEGDVMEEGQEEWLSEGILTDDDYNPGSQQTEPDCSDSNIQSQDETIATGSPDNQGQIDTSQDQLDVSHGQLDSTQEPDISQGSLDLSLQLDDTQNGKNQLDDSRIDSSNIEETLNNLENSQNNFQISDLPEELNAFLIRKVDGKIINSDAPKKDSDVDESEKQSDGDDDGNDTDDLLRVLGDGNQTKQKTDSKHDGDSSDEDDNYIFEGKKVRNLNMAKTVLNPAIASKAVPEDDDLTDCSEDENLVTLKQIISPKKLKSIQSVPKIITSVKPGSLTILPLTVKEEPKKVPNRVHQVVKKEVNVPVKKEVNIPVKKHVNVPVKREVNVPVKREVNVPVKREVNVPVKREVNVPVKREVNVPVKKEVHAPVKKVINVPVKQEVNVLVKKEVNVPVKKVSNVPINKKVNVPVKKEFDIDDFRKDIEYEPATARRQYSNKRLQGGSSIHKQNKVDSKAQSDEIVNEQFMEDGNMELDEDFTQRAKKPSKESNQKLMRPEEMDEEVPTDADSDSGEESLYDELPSSDSDTEDWFTLDIRAERAGDYIPLLGDKAYQLLTEEKRRVAARLETLKKSLATLTESGRQQAEKLKEATHTVAELDAMLKAA